MSKAVCSLFTSFFQRKQGFLGFRKFLSIFFNFRISPLFFVCVAVPLQWDDFTLKLLYVDFRLSWVDFLLLRVDFLLSWDVIGKEISWIIVIYLYSLLDWENFSEKRTSRGKFEKNLVNRLNTKILFTKLGLAILAIKLIILKAHQIKKWKRGYILYLVTKHSKKVKVETNLAGDTYNKIFIERLCVYRTCMLIRWSGQRPNPNLEKRQTRHSTWIQQ